MTDMFLSESKVQYLCEYYKVKTTKDWEDLRKSYKRIPSSINYYGLNLSNKKFLQYSECKEFLIKLKIDTIYKWIDLMKNKPKVIPSHPDSFYKEWESWKSFLNIKDGKSSTGENSIREYLNINNMVFESEKTFENCRNIKVLRFDFYCPNENLCIEYDGKQHYQSVDYFGGEEYLIY